jgi:DNA mismatch repair protein MutS2
LVSKSITTLEFNKILSTIATFASSTTAKERILSMLPLSNIDDINRILDEVEEADKAIYEYSVCPGFGFDDVTHIIQKADILSTLTMGELLKVSALLRCSDSVKKSINKLSDVGSPKLLSYAREIYVDHALQNEIDKAILSDDEISDDASPELRIIRQKIRRENDHIKTKLYTFVNSANYSKYLQDNIVTIRGDRYVIPVKSEFRGAIPGLIHDQSASGQTIYIEPMAILEMNNNLKGYILDEEREIEKILRLFTVKVSNKSSSIYANLDKLSYLDEIFARAKYASSIRAIKPRINVLGITEIEKGRHPLIPDEKVVPTSIAVGKGYDMLFITGPNTGGKTVSLKLAGLLSIMGASGLFVPARDADICIYDDIFCDIGDEQSIEQNLSTFSSHIANIVLIIDSITSNSLVLLDELGAGTDPAEGAALAVAIADHLKKVGCKAIITTHYNELKEYAFTNERVQNASMEFDPVSYSPTYKLTIGSPGLSNAIMIARKLGLNQEIIEAARQGISKEKRQFEHVLSSLEIARKNAALHEEEAQRLLDEAKITSRKVEAERDRLAAQREKLNENVKKETKRMVEEAMEEANAIISNMKALLDDPTEEDLFKARTLKKSLTKYIVNEDNEFDEFDNVITTEPIIAGDAVMIKSIRTEGTVASINYTKGTAEVSFGVLKSIFKISDLIKLDKNGLVYPATSQAKKGGQDPKLRNDGFSPEINLLGQRVYEAEAKLGEYIDKAIIAGVNQITIIHGFGTGRLRDAVRRFLKGHSAIQSLRSGEYNEGGGGVTVAALRR